MKMSEQVYGKDITVSKWDETMLICLRKVRASAKTGPNAYSAMLNLGTPVPRDLERKAPARRAMWQPTGSKIYLPLPAPGLNIKKATVSEGLEYCRKASSPPAALMQSVGQAQGMPKPGREGRGREGNPFLAANMD